MKFVCSPYHAMYIDKQGKLWVYGSNHLGKLGIGTEQNTTKFVQVSERTDIIDIAVNKTNSYFVDKEGILYSCGYNLKYNSSSNLEEYTAYFSPVITNKKVVNVWSADNTTVIKLEDGNFAILGEIDEYKTEVTEFVKFQRSFNFIHISIKEGTFIGLVYNNQTNNHKCVEYNLKNYDTNFKLISSQDNFINVSTSKTHTLLLNKEGKVYGKGRNSFYPLGKVITDNCNSNLFVTDFKELTNLPFIAQVSAGVSHSLLLTKDGDILVCGDNSNGQCSAGNNFKTVDNFTKIEVFDQPVTYLVQSMTVNSDKHVGDIQIHYLGEDEAKATNLYFELTRYDAEYNIYLEKLNQLRKSFYDTIIENFMPFYSNENVDVVSIELRDIILSHYFKNNPNVASFVTDAVKTDRAVSFTKIT